MFLVRQRSSHVRWNWAKFKALPQSQCSIDGASVLLPSQTRKITGSSICWHRDVPTSPYWWLVGTQGARRHWSYEVTITSGAEHVMLIVDGIVHYLELPWSLITDDVAKLPSKDVAVQLQMEEIQSTQEDNCTIDDGQSSRGGVVDEQSTLVQQSSHERPRTGLSSNSW